MKILVLILLILCPIFSGISQIGMGQWRLHVPNKKALDIVSDGDVLFTAFETGLMEYDISAKEISMWDNINGLSDINLSCLGYDPNTKSVFIGYKNGNIDQLQANRITNIPAIILASIPGDNSIYKIVHHNGFMYFATGVGIVKIDPDKKEVKDSYYPGSGEEAILDIAFTGDSIFAITKTTLYKGKTSNPALADPAQWSIDNRVPVLSSGTYEYGDIETINNELFLQRNATVYGGDTVFKVLQTGFELVTNTTFDIEIVNLGQINNQLLVNCTGVGFLYNANYTYNIVFSPYNYGPYSNPNNVVLAQNDYWIADNELGLVKYKHQEGSQFITFEGPPRNEFIALDWNKGVLAAVPGGIDGMVPAFTPPGVYYFEDEKWVSFNRDEEALWTGQLIHDNLSVSINPTDDNQIATGHYSRFGVSIIDKNNGVVDTFTVNNSELDPRPSTNYCHVSDVKYDPEGNLWVLNGFTTNPLKLYTKEHEWYELEIGNVASNKQSYKMAIDYSNNLWMSFNNIGMVGYNPGSSITDISDDKRINLNSGANTGALPSNNVTAIAVDFDNEIWIGTDNGFAVLYNSDNAFEGGTGSYNAQRIKLDFEGNVEYVLGHTSITDIEVDGGNRKWFGTTNAGVILLSPDGLEIIKQFTTENSPIISDNIIDIEIDQQTGEVYIVTDKGMVSYRSDASYEDPEMADVQVFPNPARPEFDGPITIQGIRFDSDVRITDVAGNLVYKTTSNGGTATWNGKTLQGEKVASGVYLIWTSPNQTKGRFVGKVVVAN